jgi:hypothetical protein
MKKIWLAALLALATTHAHAQYQAQPNVSPVTTLTTSPQNVFPGGQGIYYWIITDTGETTAYCTDDNTTPSATNYTFSIAPGGYQDSSGRQSIFSYFPTQCLVLTDTTTIKAERNP